MIKYRLLKDINRLMGNFKMGKIESVTDWLNIFYLDWLSDNEEKIEL